MEDVERVLRVVLQAADVTRAEFVQVKRGSHFAMHAAKVEGVAQAVAARRRVLCNKMRRVLTQRDAYPVEY